MQSYLTQQSNIPVIKSEYHAFAYSYISLSVSCLYYVRLFIYHSFDTKAV